MTCPHKVLLSMRDNALCGIFYCDTTGFLVKYFFEQYLAIIGNKKSRYVDIRSALSYNLTLLDK